MSVFLPNPSSVLYFSRPESRSTSSPASPPQIPCRRTVIKVGDDILRPGGFPGTGACRLRVDCRSEARVADYVKVTDKFLLCSLRSTLSTSWSSRFALCCRWIEVAVDPRFQRVLSVENDRLKMK